MENSKTREMWGNWCFEDEYLVDDGGNKYHQNDIRALFFQNQLVSNLMGSRKEICFMKSILDDKINEASKDITIDIKVGKKCIESLEFKI